MSKALNTGLNILWSEKLKIFQAIDIYEFTWLVKSVFRITEITWRRTVVIKGTI